MTLWTYGEEDSDPNNVTVFVEQDGSDPNDLNAVDCQTCPACCWACEVGTAPQTLQITINIETDSGDCVALNGTFEVEFYPQSSFSNICFWYIDFDSPLMICGLEVSSLTLTFGLVVATPDLILVEITANQYSFLEANFGSSSNPIVILSQEFNLPTQPPPGPYDCTAVSFEISTAVFPEAVDAPLCCSVSDSNGTYSATATITNVS